MFVKTPLGVTCSVVVFSPTPLVSWRRVDGAALSNHSKVVTFGLELAISRVETSDAGRYVCAAAVDATQPASAAVHHHVHLSVEG